MAAVLVDLPAAPPKSEEPAERAFEDELRKEILGKADSFIEDAISRLDWEQMQELMAGILRAMGYRTRVAPPGPDRGYDIFASPDGQILLNGSGLSHEAGLVRLLQNRIQQSRFQLKQPQLTRNRHLIDRSWRTQFPGKMFRVISRPL